MAVLVFASRRSGVARNPLSPKETAFSRLDSRQLGLKGAARRGALLLKEGGKHMGCP